MVASQVAFSIPVTETGIPFTLQSLALFIIAAFLNPVEFLIMIGLYLASGILGLPVFVNGTSGLEKIFGASGGFLYGFVFSGLYISSSISKLSNLSVNTVLNVCILATMILFFFGLLHLSIKLDFSKAINFGLKPFWFMALIKAFIASIVIWLVKRRVS